MPLFTISKAVEAVKVNYFFIFLFTGSNKVENWHSINSNFADIWQISWFGLQIPYVYEHSMINGQSVISHHNFDTSLTSKAKIKKAHKALSINLERCLEDLFTQNSQSNYIWFRNITFISKLLKFSNFILHLNIWP